jgi:hypothetical protein
MSNAACCAFRIGWNVRRTTYHSKHDLPDAARDVAMVADCPKQDFRIYVNRDRGQALAIGFAGFTLAICCGGSQLE